MLATRHFELHAPTNSTQKLKLMGRGGQFTYTSTLPLTCRLPLASNVKIRSRPQLFYLIAHARIWTRDLWPLFSRRRLGVHAPSTDLRLARLGARLARLGARLARLGVQPPHLARCLPYRLENRAFGLIELHAPTNSTQNLKLMGRGGQFAYGFNKLIICYIGFW